MGSRVRRWRGGKFGIPVGWESCRGLGGFVGVDGGVRVGSEAGR